MAKRQQVRRVAVAYPVAVPWMALFVRGVADYAARHGDWTLMTSPPTLTGAEEFAQSVYSLRGWSGDGLFAAIGSTTEARAARRLGMPVVNISGAMRHAGLPRVMIDHYAIGRMAAEHLLERGFRNLAYYGVKGLWYSQQRCRGFVERAEQAGARCEAFDAVSPASSRVSWQRQVAPLVQWLQSLKHPMGLLAAHDYRARVVMDECLQLGLRVPHDVAILGIDNDPTVCEFCRPTLSSVSRGLRFSLGISNCCVSLLSSIWVHLKLFHFRSSCLHTQFSIIRVHLIAIISKLCTIKQPFRTLSPSLPFVHIVFVLW